MCVGAGVIWEISVSSNFVVKLNLSFKKKVLKSTSESETKNW